MKISFYTPTGDYPGQFVQTLEGPLELVIEPTAAALGLPYIEGDYEAGHYVLDGQVQPRPTCPATLDSATATLHLVPPASTITINGQTYPCEEGGTVEMEFDQPGAYRIVVTGWPFLDGEFEIEISSLR